MISMAERSWCDVDLTPLDEDDLPETIRELSDVAASWRNIGTQLGIRHNRLEAIQGDKPLDCLRQMLATWLQKNYNVKRFGEPTWVKLVEVVSHSAGGENPSLAIEIAKRHEATPSSPDVPGVSEVDSAPLDLGDDFFDVQSELVPVAANWKSIGIALHLKPDVWENVDTQNSGNPRACLTLIVKEWLKRNYNVKRFGEPTWQRLVEAVGHPAGGGNMEVARRIAMKHMVERISTFRSQQEELQEEVQQEVQQERNERINQLEHQLQVVKDSEQQLKEKVELLKQNCEEMQKKLTSVHTTLSTTEEAQETLTKKLQAKEDERAALAERLQKNEDERAALEGAVIERDGSITLLEHQLQVAKNSEQQLKEIVDRERAQNQELTAAKSDSEGQFAVLQKRIKEQQDELETMARELGNLRQQLRICKGQIEDVGQLASARSEDNEHLKEELHQAVEELGEQRALVSSLQITLEERQITLEKVQQDLHVAQNNVAKLVSAASEQQQSTPVSVVDQSIYEALQLAYDNMEKDYTQMNSQFRDAQKKILDLEERNAELEAHVEQWRKGFAAKVSECLVLQLQSQLKKDESEGGEVEVMQQPVQELEMLQKVQQERNERIAHLEHQLQAVKDSEQQLKEKVDQQRAQIQELITIKLDSEGQFAVLRQQIKEQQYELGTMTEQLSVRKEQVESLEQFASAKSRHIELLREKLKEHGVLAPNLQLTVNEPQQDLYVSHNDVATASGSEKQQQQQQLSTGGKAKEENRLCPICGTQFPAHISQQVFERHVEGHFQD